MMQPGGCVRLSVRAIVPITTFPQWVRMADSRPMAVVEAPANEMVPAATTLRSAVEAGP